MNNLDESEKFDLNVFNNEAAKPDPEFKNMLKQEVLKDFEKRGFLANFSSQNYSVAFALASFAIFVFFIGYGVVSFNNILNKNVQISNKTFTTEEKSKIFENIIKNNTSNILQKSQAVAEAPKQGANLNTNENTNTVNNDSVNSFLINQAPATTSSQQLPVIVKPIGENYNYRYTNVESIPGPSIDKCNLFGSDLYNAVSESYEFFGTDRSYSKDIGKDKDGNLVNYKLTTEANSLYEYIEYKGGEFALKTIYRYNQDSFSPASYPISYPDTSTSNIKSLTTDYFGANAEITGSIQKDGIEYYLIKSEYNTACLTKDSTITNAKVDRYEAIIYVYWVNSQTFEINKTDVYLGNQEASNLIETTEVTRVVNTVDKDTLNKSFTFEYSVPIKEVDLTNINQQPSAQEVLNFLTVNKIDIIIPKNSELESMRLAETNYYLEYYLDRGYYAPGAEGDEQFNKVKDSLTISIQIKPKVVIGFKPNESLISLAIYNKGINNSDITKTLSEDLYSTEKDIEVSVNGIKIKAKSYQQSGYPTSYPYSYPTNVVIFEYNEYVYAFFVNAPGDTSEFTAYDASIEDYSPVNQWVKKNFN